jgi:hypothetical protein
LCICDGRICPKIIGDFVINMGVIDPFVNVVKCFGKFFITFFFNFFEV